VLLVVLFGVWGGGAGANEIFLRGDVGWGGFFLGLVGSCWVSGGGGGVGFSGASCSLILADSLNKGGKRSRIGGGVNDHLLEELCRKGEKREVKRKI